MGAVYHTHTHTQTYIYIYIYIVYICVCLGISVQEQRTLHTVVLLHYKTTNTVIKEYK